MSADKKQDDMNMSEMIALFQKVFFKQGSNPTFTAKDLETGCGDVISDTDDDDSDDLYNDDSYEDIDDDEDGYESDDLVNQVIKQVVTTALEKQQERKFSTLKNLREKEAVADKNAKELVAEEEKEKKKAEKRRAKKKRRKEKRKLEKDQAQKKNEDEEQEKSQSSSGSEEEDLDPTSAFVSVVANKKLSGNSQASGLKSNEDRLRRHRSDAQDENTDLQNIDPIILQSRQLAIRGNQMAAMDEFQAAIRFFTAAIKLDPHDFRYFGNRSYCYERSGNFDRALKDAERAIVIDPLWPKGHFRKGRALCGEERYAEAELCFQEVIKLDKNCSEAFTELIAARTSGIMEMGFARHVAETAAAKYNSIQDAVDVLVQESAASSSRTHQHSSSGWGKELCASNGFQEIYESDEEGATEDCLVTGKISKPFQRDDKMDPRNSENRTSLWVGNLRKEATEKSITSLFAKYGELLSVRVLLESRCAFVNYKHPLSASRAMEALQGLEYFGEHLLIRFPNHNHVVGQPSVTVLKRKNPTTKPKSLNPDFKGPVNGDECYFWRLAGCIHGNKCRYKHVPKHKGIDLK